MSAAPTMADLESTLRLMKAAPNLLDALQELVAIEDLKKSLAQANHHAARFPTDENYKVIDGLRTDIARRRAKAWEAARAELAKAVQS